MESRSGNPLGSIRTLFVAGTFGGLSDGELLDRFSTGDVEISELAIAVLVERHGPMVRRVCRSILANAHDAEDSFQATFLVLAREARSIRNRESIASWLHGVARRVAACALAAEARRRKHERQASKIETKINEDFRERHETHQIVHDELSRLPEKYRAPIVLCHLEGLTHEQAAHRLRWPVGTVRSRLSRGRDRLRERLIRRGAAPAVGVSALFGGETAPAGVPRSLVETVAHHASALAAGKVSASGPISPTILSLVEGALRAMAWTKLKIATAIVALIVTTSGLGLFAQNANQAQDKSEPPKPEAAKTAVKAERENPAPEARISHVDRLDMGRLQVGSIVEGQIRVIDTGPAFQPGIAVQIEPPLFTTVTDMRILKRTSIGSDESVVYQWTLAFDTKKPREIQGEVKIRFQDQVVAIPVFASIQPQKPDAPKVLMITGGFGAMSDEAASYDTWHKMIKADNIDISYCDMMMYREFLTKQGPRGVEQLPDELAQYDVILVDAMGTYWLCERDVTLLKQFVASGKRLVVAASPGVANSILKANFVLKSFGLQIAPEDLLSASQHFRSQKDQIVPDPLTEHVSGLTFVRPGRITVENSKFARILDSKGNMPGFLAVSRPGKGEVVAIGTPLIPAWIGDWGKDCDNLRFLRNALTKKVK